MNVPFVRNDNRADDSDSDSADPTIDDTDNRQEKQISAEIISSKGTKANQEATFESVKFIPTNDIKEAQYFSASWWQSKERFLRTFRPDRILNSEGAVFTFIHDSMQDLRMTSDWLQFSVEHLSKAFKLAGFGHRHEAPSYHLFVDKLLNYTSRTRSLLQDWENGTTNPKNSRTKLTTLPFPTKLQQTWIDGSSMPETIALIAFMPYKSGGRSRRDAVKGQVVTAANLAATIVSLVRVFCGRILIVVDSKDLQDDNDVTAAVMVATKQLLLTQQEENDLKQRLETFFTIDPPSSLVDDALNVNENKPFEFKVHHSEVALVAVNCTKEEGTLSDQDSRWIPKAALLGLQKAFLGTNLVYSQQWLGIGETVHGGHHSSDNNINNKNNTSSRWNFVYLTEPDTILHAKLQSLPALSREVQSGNIVVLHRLQPIPHERDLPGYSPDRIVPNVGNLSRVVTLGSEDRCCDAGSYAPGPAQTSCGQFWWMCGFSSIGGGQNTGKNSWAQRHFRLASYEFMTLQEGTGIISLAGSEHGRQCIPTPLQSISNENSHAC